MNDISLLLKENSYPGRGIIIGQKDNCAVLAYFIMGRSENSRNRVFKASGADVTIFPFDSSLVKDPSLIIYSPLRVLSNYQIISNGDQTDTIYDYLKADRPFFFDAALQTRGFEPDAPNFTPRISGLLDLNGGFSYKLSILKSGDKKGGKCFRQIFSYEPINRCGHLIHTYEKDGNPLPSFSGEPRIIAITQDVEEFTNTLWSSLDQSNKISLLVRYIDIITGRIEQRIINKNEL